VLLKQELHNEIDVWKAQGKGDCFDDAISENEDGEVDLYGSHGSLVVQQCGNDNNSFSVSYASQLFGDDDNNNNNSFPESNENSSESFDLCGVMFQKSGSRASQIFVRGGDDNNNNSFPVSKESNGELRKDEGPLKKGLKWRARRASWKEQKKERITRRNRSKIYPSDAAKSKRNRRLQRKSDRPSLKEKILMFLHRNYLCDGDIATLPFYYADAHYGDMGFGGYIDSEIRPSLNENPNYNKSASGSRNRFFETKSQDRQKLGSATKYSYSEDTSHKAKKKSQSLSASLDRSDSETTIKFESPQDILLTLEKWGLVDQLEHVREFELLYLDFEAELKASKRSMVVHYIDALHEMKIDISFVNYLKQLGSKNFDYRGLTLDIDLTMGDFRGINFGGCDLQNATLKHTQFDKEDLKPCLMPLNYGEASEKKG